MKRIIQQQNSASEFSELWQSAESELGERVSFQLVDPVIMAEFGNELSEYDRIRDNKEKRGIRLSIYSRTEKGV